MKKRWIILIIATIALLIGVLAVRSIHTESKTETTIANVSSSTTDVHSQASSVSEVSASVLILPPPESIVLDPNSDLIEEFSYIPIKRKVFFMLTNRVMRLVPEENFNEFAAFLEEQRTFGVEPTEMASVTFIKYFEIEKVDFERVIGERKEFLLSLDIDITEEENELPNPNIIYTFDNEIINAYYRRDNPIEPDWTKTKIYESYSAFLKANPQ